MQELVIRDQQGQRKGVQQGQSLYTTEERLHNTIRQKRRLETSHARATHQGRQALFVHKPVTCNHQTAAFQSSRAKNKCMCSSSASVQLFCALTALVQTPLEPIHNKHTKQVQGCTARRVGSSVLMLEPSCSAAVNKCWCTTQPSHPPAAVAAATSRARTVTHTPMRRALLNLI
jgi:hypothetical protein